VRHKVVLTNSSLRLKLSYYTVYILTAQLIMSRIFGVIDSQHVTHVSGTSLTACYRVVALLYGLGLIGLRVTILGPLYYTAPPHLHPLMEDCRWTGQSCVQSS
jgi:hypothetical protein